MRYQHLKLRKGHSTKSERKLAELLKELHIPFRTKIKIANREVDFLIGGIVIEIDSHLQDSYKNRMLLSEGYIPFHLSTWEIKSKIKDWLKKLWQTEQEYMHQKMTMPM